MTRTQVALGARLAAAIGRRWDLDIWWMVRPHEPPHGCIRCGRVYRSAGWLYRHYARTAHHESAPWTRAQIGEVMARWVAGFLCRRGCYGLSRWWCARWCIPHYQGIPLYRSRHIERAP